MPGRGTRPPPCFGRQPRRGRPNRTRRLFSGCIVSPNRPRRFGSTSSSRWASDSRSTTRTLRPRRRGSALRLPPSRRPRLRSSLAGGLPCPSATRRKKGLPGAWAVLFQRAVGSDPAGCASRRAHRVETAIAFRLHNALGTQNERYFVAVNPTAHSLACLRIGVFVTADAARLATGVGGSPFTGRVSHPLDGKQSFMTSPHRHSPLTSLAWSHHATTPRPVATCATIAGQPVRCWA